MCRTPESNVMLACSSDFYAPIPSAWLWHCSAKLQLKNHASMLRHSVLHSWYEVKTQRKESREDYVFTLGFSEVVLQKHQGFCLFLPEQQQQGPAPERSPLELPCPPVVTPPAVSPTALTHRTTIGETVVQLPSAGNDAGVILVDLAAA